MQDLFLKSIFHVREFCILAEPSQVNRACRAVSLLSDDQLCLILFSCESRSYLPLLPFSMRYNPHNSHGNQRCEIRNFYNSYC